MDEIAPREPPAKAADAAPPDPPAEPAEASISGAARGQLAGWAAVAAVSAAAIAIRLPMPHGGGRVRALHHAYDAGQLLAAGLLAATAVEAWERWGPRRRWLGLAAIATASLAIGALTVSEDVEVAAGKLPGPTLPWQATLVAAIALTVPVTAALARALVRPGDRAGSALARTGRRVIAAAAGLGFAVTSHLVLPNDYPGVHLYLTWMGATALGVAAWVDHTPERKGRIGLALRAALAVVAAASLVVRPRSSVTVELTRSGAVIAPWVLRAHAAASAARPPAGRGAWFSDRSALPPIPPSQPSLLPKDAIVIMLTVDALRADVVADGARAAALPNLTALRRQSVELTMARSASSQTNSSLSTLFTGKYFSQLYWSIRPGGVMTIPCAHEDQSPRFPEILAEGGVRTVTFTRAPGLVNAYGLVRGFQEERVVHGKRFVTAKKLTDVALKRIGRHVTGPLFLYIHLMDAHAPYNLGGTEGTAYERYVREVALVDAALGRIRDALAARGLDERTTLILSADHGEAFGEHRTYHHATTLYDELIRVPLLIRVPGVRPRAVDVPVSLVDLGPTVLDLMGFPTPGAMMGQSLVPLLRGDDPELTRPIVAESSRGLRAIVFPDGWKAIYDRRKGSFELYDLTRDPGELQDLADEGAASADRLELLKAFFYVHELRRPGYVTPYIR